MKKEVRIQVRLDRGDVKLIEQLIATKKYGPTVSEVLRRGLICLKEQELRKGK